MMKIILNQTNMYVFFANIILTVPYTCLNLIMNSFKHNVEFVLYPKVKIFHMNTDKVQICVNNTFEYPFLTESFSIKDGFNDDCRQLCRRFRANIVQTIEIKVKRRGLLVKLLRFEDGRLRRWRQLFHFLLGWSLFDWLLGWIFFGRFYFWCLMFMLKC